MAMNKCYRVFLIILILSACVFEYSFAQLTVQKKPNGLSHMELRKQFVRQGTELVYRDLFNRYKLDQKAINSLTKIECGLGNWKIRIDLKEPLSKQHSKLAVTSVKTGKVILRHELSPTLRKDTILRVVSTDLNGDDYPDIVISSGVIGTGVLGALHNMTLLLFTEDSVHSIDVNTFGPGLDSLVDLDGDGKAEFVCEYDTQWDTKSVRHEDEVDRYLYVFYNIFAFNEFTLRNVTRSMNYKHTCFVAELGRGGFHGITNNGIPKRLVCYVSLSKPKAWRF